MWRKNVCIALAIDICLGNWKQEVGLIVLDREEIILKQNFHVDSLVEVTLKKKLRRSAFVYVSTLIITYHFTNIKALS